MKVEQNTKRPLQSSRFRAATPRRNSGMTLLEMTVVILVLLSLITILFLGAQAWKRGSDRAICIINIQNVQKGVRSYSNLYGFEPGTSVTGLKEQIIGFGRFVENNPTCPGGGVYSFESETMIPNMGILYMECELAHSDQHVPNATSDW